MCKREPIILCIYACIEQGADTCVCNICKREPLYRKESESPCIARTDGKCVWSHPSPAFLKKETLAGSREDIFVILLLVRTQYPSAEKLFSTYFCTCETRSFNRFQTERRRVCAT